MSDPSEPTQDDAAGDGIQESAESRRPLLIAAVVGAVLVIVLLVLLAVTRDDDSDSADATTSTTAAATGDTDATDTTEAPQPGTDEPGTDDTAAPSDEAEAVATSVPIEAVAGTTEAELCTAIVARIELYRAVVVESIPDEDLIAALEEFEAQIDVQSDDQDWGDSIMESLTNVRREWATARSAAAAGEDAEARARTDASIEHLDDAIATPCPTA
jgi:hypothetical protein